MPRQRILHSRRVYVFPRDFPRRLELFKKASDLSWAELARHLGTLPLTIRRWRAGVRPNAQHLMALLEIAEDLGLNYLLTAKRVVETDETASSQGEQPRNAERGDVRVARSEGRCQAPTLVSGGGQDSHVGPVPKGEAHANSVTGKRAALFQEYVECIQPVAPVWGPMNFLRGLRQQYVRKPWSEQVAWLEQIPRWLGQMLPAGHWRPVQRPYFLNRLQSQSP